MSNLSIEVSRTIEVTEYSNVMVPEEVIVKGMDSINEYLEEEGLGASGSAQLKEDKEGIDGDVTDRDVTLGRAARGTLLLGKVDALATEVVSELHHDRDHEDVMMYERREHLIKFIQEMNEA